MVMHIRLRGVISGMLTGNHEEMVWEDGREKPMWLSFEKGNETRAGLCTPAEAGNSRGRNWRGSSLNCLTDLLDLAIKREAA